MTRQLGSKVAHLSGGTRCLRGAHRQSERNQSLLQAVVEVSFDPAARLVRRSDDPQRDAASSARAIRIRNRGWRASSVNFSSRLSASAGSGTLAETVAAPPKAALHDDRGRNRRDDAQAAPGWGPTGPLTDDESLSSTRAERPVRYTSADANASSSCHACSNRDSRDARSSRRRRRRSPDGRART